MKRTTMAALALCASALTMAQNPFIADEPSAEQILNNQWKWPTFEGAITTQPDLQGFAFDRLGKRPKQGIHPRILFSTQEIGTIRKNIESTQAGRALYANLKGRIKPLETPQNWEYRLLQLLIEGKDQEAASLLDKKEKPNGKPGHYQPYFVYEMMLKSFDALLYDRKDELKELAKAFGTYARILRPRLEENYRTTPFPTDAWRSGGKEIIAYHNFAYLYDFLHNHMSNKDRDTARQVIATSTQGQTIMGMLIPPHMVNWNWCACAQSNTLNLIAIEGEKGYDQRAYRKMVEVMKNYLTYGIDRYGSSTEAVGYTAFGFNWALPTMIAVSREGHENLLAHPHYRAMRLWYLHSLLPDGKRFNSRGDGGEGGPKIEQYFVLKYFYPEEPVIDYLLQQAEKEPTFYSKNQNLIVPLLCASDASQTDYQYGKRLNQPVTFYDDERGALLTRSEWNKDATMFHFEARKDQHGPSHDHADRGTFSLAALGRAWTMDGFRAVDSKNHNTILINGKGQGFFTPSATWIKQIETPEASFGVVDIKYCYDWWWPKTFLANTQPNDPILKTNRYKGFAADVEEFWRIYGNARIERDPSAPVVTHFKGFEKGTPRVWDEDGWTVRMAHNPVERAFRTAGLVRGNNPYVLIVDDIQKNDHEALYEWMMQVEWDLNLIKADREEMILGGVGNDVPGASSASFNLNPYRPKRGEPMLLIRCLNRSLKSGNDHDQNPSPRMEIYEKAETRLKNGRQFGLQKRLVIPSLSTSPDFKVLLFPFRQGDPLPETSWNEERTVLTLRYRQTVDTYTFKLNEKGMTETSLSRNGKRIF